MLTGRDRKNIIQEMVRRFQVEFVFFNEKSVINGWASTITKKIFWVSVKKDLQIGTDKDLLGEEVVKLVYKNMEANRLDGLSDEMKDFIVENYESLLIAKIQDLPIPNRLKKTLSYACIDNVFDFLSILVFEKGNYTIPFKKIRNFSTWSLDVVIQVLKKNKLFP